MALLLSSLNSISDTHIIRLLASILREFLTLLYVLHMWRKLICSGESCTGESCSGETTAVGKFSCLVLYSSKYSSYVFQNVS